MYPVQIVTDVMEGGHLRGASIPGKPAHTQHGEASVVILSHEYRTSQTHILPVIAINAKI